MEAIAVNRKKQKKLNTHVKNIKKQLQDGLQVKKELKTVQAKKKPSDDRGVVYLGHIPHGFFEDEIEAYCSQFGRVTRVRVARSKNTGRSKGYAFVEFQHPEVAKIVAETINNYLMFNRLLKCEYIPTEKRNKKMFWRSITASKFPAQRNREMDTRRKNDGRDMAKEDERKQKKRRKIEDFKNFFEERGIEFNFKVNDPNGDLTAPLQETPAVLEIDESDDEVEFNTPPHVMKVFKKTKKQNGMPKSTVSTLRQKPKDSQKGAASKRSRSLMSSKLKKPIGVSKESGSKAKGSKVKSVK